MMLQPTDISTHALTWSATTLKLPDIIMVPFQLTHSRGVRPSSGAIYAFSVNFNSRTHVECDKAWKLKSGRRIISTHALTWSATKC